MFTRAWLDHSMYKEEQNRNGVYTESKKAIMRTINTTSYQRVVWDLERAVQGDVGTML